MTKTEHDRLIKQYQKWRVDPLSWLQFAFPDAEYTFQHLELIECYRRLIVAKLKRWNGAPLTAEEEADADKMGISIQSGHGVGKDCMSVQLGLHFICNFYNPKVICTAPAGPTLDTNLWPEFHKWIRQSDYVSTLIQWQAEKIFWKEAGKAEWWIQKRTIPREASEDAKGVAIAGIHEDAVLYIVDEASDIPESVALAIEGCMTGPMNMMFMIYNPTRTNGYAIETHTKHRKWWMCLHWDGEDLHGQAPSWFDTKMHTRLAEKFGRDSDYYRMRVKGLPPTQSSDALIQMEWVLEAKTREFEPVNDDPLVIGVDVGGGGADKSVLVVRRGPTVLEIREFKDIDDVQLGWKIEACLRDYLNEWDKDFRIGVDTIGIGRGVYSYLTRTANLKHVYSINVAEKPAVENRFHRLRDQVWWELREAFQNGTIAIPDDDDLVGELTVIKWDEPNGKIKVEGKPELKKRGVPSPNKADALGITEYLQRFCTSTMKLRHRRNKRWAGSHERNWKVAI